MSTTLIRLPVERAHQLKALAAHKNLTMADLVAELIDAETNRLGISDEIGLGYQINVDRLENGVVRFSATEIGTFQWDKPTALNVSVALERVADSRGGHLDIDSGLEMRRVGTSVKVKNIETGGERTFAPSIARALATNLRKAAL